MGGWVGGWVGLGGPSLVTDVFSGLCRAQAYVGAFLRKETKGEAASGVDGAQEAGPVSQLYEVGTFAQVHTILAGDTPDSAQLLLLGHRRIRRTSVVSTVCWSNRHWNAEKKHVLKRAG